MTWLSKRELKIYILVVGIITLIALLITLIILLPGYIRYNKIMNQSNTVPEKTIDMSRFIIPESYKHLREKTWAHFIPDRDKWTRLDIEPYWQNPEEIVLDYLEQENRKYIDDIFKVIP
jgi:hypothetical protein